ncbi:unnamed protein product [Cylindrotheca closterium]|uniref:DUF6824 domain-containing protein n=1 Tax=Cylindrotheca closterium TaxID=2856 RepID=A0AAD2FVT3_9STRA|nr:unnamed protein product [Cylindrotheca closterium]
MNKDSTESRQILTPTAPIKNEEEAEKSRSPSTVPKASREKKSDAARYAALRNHRIRLEDAIDPDAERVSRINKTDILFGRGKGFQNHPGNQRMREIVEKYKIKYHTLRRTEKQDLIEAVYQELTEGGARFLKKLEKEETWVNVDRPVALQKVSHTLRCRKGVLDKVMNDQAITAPNKFVAEGMSQVQQRLLSTSLAGLHTSFNPASGGISPSLEAQRFSAANLPNLEAQRIAALERFRALTTMPFMNTPTPAPQQVPSLMDHYNNLKREQIMREYMIQQMQQKQLLSGMGFMNNMGNMGAPNKVADPSPTNPTNHIFY